jgi:pyruvate,orthophosphate dikinase
VFYGEYLINAQGEDVVAGVRTPKPVAQLSKEMPDSHQQLLKVRELLEKHFRDMQDLEFTIEDNRLYILQTRNGKRTGLAAIKIAVDMVREKLISREEALLRIPADSLSYACAHLRQGERKNATKIEPLPAGPGAASGHLVLRAEEAVLRPTGANGPSRSHRNTPETFAA